MILIPTVYVTQQPVPNRNNWMPNLESATQYGKIEYVFQGGERIWVKPNINLQRARLKLQRMNPEEDYVLWPNTGDPASLWTCMIAIMEKYPAKIQFLYWERKLNEGGIRSLTDGFYTPVVFEPRNFQVTDLQNQ